MTNSEQSNDQAGIFIKDDFHFRHESFNEIVHHLQHAQFLKSINPEKLNELIQKFKNCFASSAFDELNNRFASKDKDFLIKLIKSIS